MRVPNLEGVLMAVSLCGVTPRGCVAWRRSAPDQQFIISTAEMSPDFCDIDLYDDELYEARARAGRGGGAWG